jgi:hypothetical protein
MVSIDEDEIKLLGELRLHFHAMSPDQNNAIDYIVPFHFSAEY